LGFGSGWFLCRPLRLGKDSRLRGNDGSGGFAVLSAPKLRFQTVFGFQVVFEAV